MPVVGCAGLFAERGGKALTEVLFRHKKLWQRCVSHESGAAA
jgi:hypothetical protein